MDVDVRAAEILVWAIERPGLVVARAEAIWNERERTFPSFTRRAFGEAAGDPLDQQAVSIVLAMAATELFENWELIG